MFDGRLLLLCTLLDLGLVGWRLLPSAGQRRRLPRQRALATIPGQGRGAGTGKARPAAGAGPVGLETPSTPTTPALLRYPMPCPRGPPALDARAAALGATFVPTTHLTTLSHPAHTISSIAHF
jgi:hypothetical protein